MISCGHIFAFVFGMRIFFIDEGLILFVVLKFSVAKVRNHLISIVLIPLFLIKFQKSLL